MDKTILDRLDRQANERGDRPAVADPRGGRYDAWDTLTWREYAKLVTDLARALHAIGHRPGDAVGVLGPNSISWVAADLAAMAAGGMPAGIYSTLLPEAVHYILQHSGASVAVVSDMGQAQKILSGVERLPKLKAVILFRGVKKPEGAPALVLTWEEALARAGEVGEATIHEIRRAIEPKGLATLIYTSGTTGPPKGVMLSHENLTWTSEVALRMVAARPGDRACSYLPLSHIAEQMLTIHVPITAGGTVHFVPVLNDLAEALKHVRPTGLFGVPRVWEKIQAKVDAGVAGAPRLKRHLFMHARQIGLAVNKPRYEGKEPPFGPALLYPLFDRLVYGKLRAALGLDQARMLVSGAAALSPATRDWFLSLGLPISEVYGQSEDSGPTTFNQDGQCRLGTVGKPIPGVELRIAEDGEILVRGRNVFTGYLKDDDATRAALTEDGWLKSGDVGELTPDGYLRITDRKKDLIKTAGGKYAAPQNIEKELREAIPLISQVIVIGEGYKYLTALMTVVPEKADELLKARGIVEGDPARRVQHGAVRETIERAIKDQVNPKLARYETIKRFDILPRELSEETGELTPSLKIKRKVVNERYAAVIAKMYEEGAGGGRADAD